MTPKKQKTWLITGGAGFIGSHLARELIKDKQKVIIFDNFSSSDGSLIKDLKKSVKIINGDIRDLQAIIHASKGVDYILHHAALVSVPQSVAEPNLTKEINTEGTFNVLFAALKNNIKKVVFASSSAVYGDTNKMPCRETAKTAPLSPYAQTKLQGEDLCKMFWHFYGLECVILRYFNVFGPGQNPSSPYSAVVAKFIDNVKHSDTFTIEWDGKQSRDFVYVQDVAAANKLAVQKASAGEVYNVARGTTCTLLQLAKTIEILSGKKMKCVFKPKRAGDIKKSAASIAKIKKLGYTPSATLKEGLRVMLKG